MVEQGTENPCVAGSIPAGATNLLCFFSKIPVENKVSSEKRTFYEVYFGEKRYSVCLQILKGIQSHLNAVQSAYEAALAEYSSALGFNKVKAKVKK